VADSAKVLMAGKACTQQALTVSASWQPALDALVALGRASGTLLLDAWSAEHSSGLVLSRGAAELSVPDTRRAAQQAAAAPLALPFPVSLKDLAAPPHLYELISPAQLQLGRRPLAVFEVLSEVDATKQDEWMYVLHQPATDADPSNTCMTDAVKLLAAGESAAAFARLAELPSDYVSASLLAQLLASAQALYQSRLTLPSPSQ
jgi:hypothetical protein